MFKNISFADQNSVGAGHTDYEAVITKIIEEKTVDKSLFQKLEIQITNKDLVGKNFTIENGDLNSINTKKYLFISFLFIIFKKTNNMDKVYTKGEYDFKKDVSKGEQGEDKIKKHMVKLGYKFIKKNKFIFEWNYNFEETIEYSFLIPFYHNRH